jgi:hypothetical protein
VDRHPREEEEEVVVVVEATEIDMTIAICTDRGATAGVGRRLVGPGGAHPTQAEAEAHQQEDAEDHRGEVVVEVVADEGEAAATRATAAGAEARAETGPEADDERVQGISS